MRRWSAVVDDNDRITLSVRAVTHRDRKKEMREGETGRLEVLELPSDLVKVLTASPACCVQQPLQPDVSQSSGRRRSLDESRRVARSCSSSINRPDDERRQC